MRDRSSTLSNPSKLKSATPSLADDQLADLKGMRGFTVVMLATDGGGGEDENLGYLPSANEGSYGAPVWGRDS